jgi:lipopolysaccharide/colanic/teichoic acid biosynthesis glycosyltransferase
MQKRAAHGGLPRTAEICLALAGLLLLVPLLAALAVGVKASSHGPVLFRQKRIGRRGQEFVLYKFRSMRSDAGGLKLTAEDDRRLTRAGKWLRRYKLDELPQLWNVLRGEMSFVGPRPEVREYVDADDPLWQDILAVRPGITDPVALRLRNDCWRRSKTRKLSTPKFSSPTSCAAGRNTCGIKPGKPTSRCCCAPSK